MFRIANIKIQQAEARATELRPPVASTCL